MLFLVVPCLNCCPYCTYCIVILLLFLPLTFSNIITAKKSSIKKWGFSRKQTIVCLTKDLVIYLLCTSYLWFPYCSSLISLLLKYIHSTPSSEMLPYILVYILSCIYNVICFRERKKFAEVKEEGKLDLLYSNQHSINIKIQEM